MEKGGKPFPVMFDTYRFYQWFFKGVPLFGRRFFFTYPRIGQYLFIKLF